MAGENGLLVGYKQAGYCYEKMGGIENQKKADAFFKMAKTAENTRVETQVKGMKQAHHFKSFDHSNQLIQKLAQAFPSLNDPSSSTKLVGNAVFIKCEDAAAQSDAEAQYQMGLNTKPKEESLKYFKLAADQGHCLAQVKMGDIFDEQDQYEEAYKYYKLAANQGDSKAQNILGYYFQNGLGVNKNASEAFIFINWLRVKEKSQGDASSHLGAIKWNRC